MKKDEEEIRTKITKLYKDLLEREPDTIGLEYYVNSISNRIMSFEDVKRSFLDSYELGNLNPHYKFLRNNPPPPRPMGFFDDYPIFSESSKTAMGFNRLNTVYTAIIKNNKNLINGSSILDIASHDGRWSFAAIMNGAKHVLGIEARKHLVNNAITNMKKLNVPQEKYSFILGDINEEITKIKPNKFDIVFCFGYFYHTLNHWFLLSEIKRLNPQYLILDVTINPSNDPIIQIKKEDTTHEGAAWVPGWDTTDGKFGNTLVGYPNKSAIEIMLDHFGFDYNYFDWHKQGIKNWKEIGEYYQKLRISLVAHNLSYTKD